MDRQRLREATFSRQAKFDGRPLCPWCGQELRRNQELHLHEAIVKCSATSKANHHLIMVPENLVLLHGHCHIEHGQTRDMKRCCIDYLCRMLGRDRVSSWYNDLRRKHGLSLPNEPLLDTVQVQ